MQDSPAEPPVVGNGAAVKRLLETVPDDEFGPDVEAALLSVDICGFRAAPDGCSDLLPVDEVRRANRGC